MKTCRLAEKKGGREGGFGLLETLVAVVILSVVFTSLFSAIRGGTRALRTVQEQERVRQVLVSKAEQLRMLYWNTVTNGTLATNFSSLLYENLTNSPTLNGTLTFQATPFTDTYATNLYKVSVNVTWTSSGQTKTSSVETLIAKDGIWSLSTP